MTVTALRPTPSVANLNPLNDILTALREEYEDMTCAQVLVLTTAALQPGISQTELTEKTKLAKSSISRIITLFGHGRKDTASLNLLDVREVPDNRRLKAIYLTSKGQRLVDFILQKMQGAARDSAKEE